MIRSIEIYREAWGAEHVLTQGALAVLADIYDAMGDQQQAESIRQSLGAQNRG